jgi:hypothetical protein
MKRIILMILLVCFLLAGSSVLAQQPAASSQDQAATELLKMMGFSQNLEVSINGMAEAMIKSNPALEQFRDVITDWAKKYITWDAVAPQLIQAYKEAFTEGELRELIAFYRTPTGQKILQQTPILMQKGMTIGSDLAQAHVPELQQMIADRVKELEKKKP